MTEPATDHDCLVCGRRRRHDQPEHDQACARCQDTTNTRLEEIVTLWATLPGLNERTPQDETQPQGKHGKKPAYPAPIRLDILALHDTRNAALIPNCGYSPCRCVKPCGLQHDIPHPPTVLFEIAADVHDHRGLPDMPTKTVSSLVAFLQRHAQWLWEQDWCDDYAQTIRTLWRELKTVHGEKTGRRPIGYCPGTASDPDCERPLHLRKDGTVRCRCGAYWTGTDLLRLADILITEQAG